MTWIEQAPEAGGCATGDEGDRGDRGHMGYMGHRWHRGKRGKMLGIAMRMQIGCLSEICAAKTDICQKMRICASANISACPSLDKAVLQWVRSVTVKSFEKSFLKKFQKRGQISQFRPNFTKPYKTVGGGWPKFTILTGFGRNIPLSDIPQISKKSFSAAAEDPGLCRFHN